MFNGRFFNQFNGTAMGTKMEPTYATLTLDYLEQMLRDLDDCFIVWSKEESNLNIVNTILNTLDPEIK